tara:strand:+ start:4644 stop:4916 length:273 start_codon:yes stop_codon:yes gene_type:complete
MKLKLRIEADRISPLKLLDMDVDTSRVYRPGDVEGMEAIKCDDEYFLIPEGENDLAKIAVDENQITEAKALGLQGMMEKYIAPYFKVEAG